MDTLYSWFATANEQELTPGYFRVTREDGSQRQLRCYYESGLEGDLSEARSGANWRDVTVKLRAPSPFATDVTEINTTYALTDIPHTTILNAGQLAVQPLWSILGPCTYIGITNATTGKIFELSFVLAAGKTVIIDTRPDTERPTISTYDSDGNNRYPNVVAGSDYWALPAGTSAVDIVLAGTGVGTLVAVQFLQQYYGLVR